MTALRHAAHFFVFFLPQQLRHPQLSKAPPAGRPAHLLMLPKQNLGQLRLLLAAAVGCKWLLRRLARQPMLVPQHPALWLAGQHAALWVVGHLVLASQHAALQLARQHLAQRVAGQLMLFPKHPALRLAGRHQAPRVASRLMLVPQHRARQLAA